MLRRTRRVLLLLFALLVSAHVGIEEVRAQEDIVPAHQFLIRNKSRVEVIFSLRKGWGPWYDYRLRPGEDHLYEDKDQVWFSPAGQDPIHREVKLGQRYKFIFDGVRWDFAKIDPDQAEEALRRRARQRGALRQAAEARGRERTACCRGQHLGGRFRLLGAGACLPKGST